MSVVLKPTLSRWGRSVYETSEDIVLEQEYLTRWVRILDEYADAEIVVLHSKQHFGEAELLGLQNVKIVITTTSGWDHIDVEYLRSNGIRCARMPMVRRDAVVESILGMLLHHNRRQWRFQEDAVNGVWSRGELNSIMPHRLQDQSVAVVGLGVIGKQLVSVLQYMGANVFGCDPYASDVLPTIPRLSFSEVPECADVVLFACNLNESTYEMVNKRWLERCHNMILINCARGQLINFDDVVDGLKKDKLSFVGLDVFPEEPFSNLSMCTDFTNVLFTPHAAGYHPQIAKLIREGLLELVQNWIQSGSVPHEL